MAAEMAQALVDTNLEQCPASSWVGITVLTVGAVCLAFHLVRSYSPSNRLDLFERELQAVEKLYEDSRDVLQVYGMADKIKGKVERRVSHPPIDSLRISHLYFEFESCLYFFADSDYHSMIAISATCSSNLTHGFHTSVESSSYPKPSANT